MSIIKIVLLIIVLATTIGYTFESSGESVNPFNEYNKGSNGVDLFTGTVALSTPLYTLPSKGSVSVPISLQYSSNVNTNVRAKNDIAPTGWVGLGWELSFGKITCRHHNTMTDADDEYFWVTTEGVKYPMYSKGGTYYIKNQPYVKITKSKVGNYIYGWTIVDPSGTIYKYGDFNDQNLKSANLNWTTLCWESSGHVGKGFAGEPKAYPYQWNVGEISDVNGNWIRFKYTLFTGDVSYTTENTSIKWNPLNSTYTKQCYISNIYSNDGTNVTFTTDKKTSDEYYIPFTGVTGGKETNQPMYDSCYLKEITITNSINPLPYIKRFSFSYQFINTGANYHTKRLLQSITEENGKPDNGIHGKKKTIFAYFIDENDTKGSYGALKSILNNEGGSTQYEYEKKVLTQVEKSTIYPKKFYIQPKVAVGRASDGEEFYTIFEQNQKECYVRKWDRTHWKDTTFKFDDHIWHVYAANNYFIAELKDETNHWYIKLFRFNGATWDEEPVTNLYLPTDLKLYLYDNYFIAIDQPLGDGKDSWYYIRNPDNGTWDGKKEEWKDIPGELRSTIITNSKCMLSYRDNVNDQKDVYYLKTWNGTGWNPIEAERRGDNAVQKILTNDYSDMFVEYYHPNVDKDSPKNRYWYGYKFNGEQWQSRFNYGGIVDILPLGKNPLIRLSDDLFLFIEEGVAFNWNGFEWQCTKTFGTNDAFPIGDNRVAVKSGNTFTLWNWDTQNNSWTASENGSTIDVGFDFPNVNSGINYALAAEKLDGHESSLNYQAKVAIWNGNKWQVDTINDSIHKTLSYLLGQAEISNQSTISGSNSFMTSMYVFDPPVGVGDESKLWCFILKFWRKFQDSFINTPSCYVVSKRSTSNGVDNKKVTSEFSYDVNTATYDAQAGTGMFQKVSISQPGLGTETRYFKTDKKEQWGLPWKTESSVRSSENQYEVYRPADGTWPQDIYHTRLTSTTTKQDGVQGETTNEYNNQNGQVQRTTEKNSDKKSRITDVIYAFQQTPYKSMQTLNMLTQKYGSKVLCKENEKSLPVVVSSNVTTWKSFNTEGTIWRPGISYAWNVPMSSNGLPSDDIKYKYSDYKNDGTASPNWVVASGKVEKYDEWGRPINTTDIMGVHSSIILDNNYNQTIATISNASYDECAVYTCDRPPTNGWNLGATSTVVSAFKKHFGDSTVYVNGQWGPNVTITGINTKRNYTLSSWVYPTDNKHINLAADLSKNGAYSRGLAWLDTSFSNADLNKWHKLSIKIPKENLSDLTPTTNYQIFLTVTALSGNSGAKFYVDDIRFYPSDAIVTTTYYDDTLGLPMLTVDANDNPSHKITCDGFGRVTKEEKVDKTKSFGDPGYGTTLVTKEYYLMGPNKPANSPTNGSKTKNGTDFTFSWMGGDPDGDKVRYVVYLLKYIQFTGILVGNEKIAQTNFITSSSNTIVTDPVHVAINPMFGYKWLVRAIDEINGGNVDGPKWDMK